MSTEDVTAEIAAMLAAHDTKVGPITGTWACACGAQSDNTRVSDGGPAAVARRADYRAHLADALADLLAARDRRVRNVAEDIAYEHAATIDGEFGCCHDEAELRAGGRAPAFDGDEFDPLPEDCDGKRILDRHLAAIHAASEADA